MPNKIAILLFTISSVYLRISLTRGLILKENEKIEGYYWRDYKGFIPQDAFPGGRDAKGRKTYIGQILHGELLIPGEIRELEKRAYYEWGFQELVATENIKILCTSEPEKLQWVPTTKDTFKTITDVSFVPGGYEKGNEFYIGRKAFNELTIVGKLQVRLADREAVFHYPRERKGNFDYEFEVLSYSKKLKYITISFYL